MTWDEEARSLIVRLLLLTFDGAARTKSEAMSAAATFLLKARPATVTVLELRLWIQAARNSLTPPPNVKTVVAMLEALDERDGVPPNMKPASELLRDINFAVGLLDAMETDLKLIERTDPFTEASLRCATSASS